MNAKHSHCMNKVTIIFAACIMICCGAALSAQTFESLERRNPWNTSRNAAGILKDSLSRSYAEIYGEYAGGGFRDTWQASEQWSAGAVTRSIRHLEKISFAGSFAFDQTEGYDMCGSMFIEPGYFPVDVLEFTPGRKTLQTYSFDGGVAYRVNDRYSLGVKVDFLSANLAKRKDLRHSNWKLDLSVMPGFTTSLGDWTFGLAAVLNKRSETVRAEQIGTAESSYHAFFDKGLMYGVEQVWTGSGVHLNESGVNGFPVSELSYGGALQMQYKELYVDLEYLRTSGTVGEKEYIWFRYPGNRFSARLSYRFVEDASSHLLKVSFDMKRQVMDESVLEKVTENGVTTVTDHGSNRIFSRGMWSVAPEYDFESVRVDVHAGLSVDGFRGQSSQIYPYVMSQSVLNVGADAKVLVHLGRFDLGAGLDYARGYVDETEDTVAQSQTQTQPYRLQDWYDRQMEYRTASRLGAGLSLRYNFAKGMYVEAAGDWLHGFGLKYIDGADRFAASLKVGYAF